MTPVAADWPLGGRDRGLQDASPTQWGRACQNAASQRLSPRESGPPPPPGGRPARRGPSSLRVTRIARPGSRHCGTASEHCALHAACQCGHGDRDTQWHCGRDSGCQACSVAHRWPRAERAVPTRRDGPPAGGSTSFKLSEWDSESCAPLGPQAGAQY
jgi:hypothetical protein